MSTVLPAWGGLKFGMGIGGPGLGSTIGIAAAQMDKLGLDIRSFREPLTRSVKQVMAGWSGSIAQNFEAGGRPDRWAELSESTLYLRDNLHGYTSMDPLLRTGRLRQVAQQINLWYITSTSATVPGMPNKVWYGRIHQEGYPAGTTSGSRMTSARLAQIQDAQRVAMATGTVIATGNRGVSDIPARPFIMFQDKDIEDIEEIFIKWFEERANKRGY